MNLLEKILNCKEEELNELISQRIEELNASSTKVQQLGFGTNSMSLNTSGFRGFIPLDTRIRYGSFELVDYNMNTTDFFYEFASFVRKYNVNNLTSFIQNLEPFINMYFGLPGTGKRDRTALFQRKAWNTTKTDDEFFEALQNSTIGDLKRQGNAECTERAALAQQILSFFGIESYYCMGCAEVRNSEVAHCFNIVKLNDNYKVLDYSMPVTFFDKEGHARAFYPFIGTLTKNEFDDFMQNQTIKTFPDFEYVEGKRYDNNNVRKYVVGAFQLQQTDSLGQVK